MLAPARDVLRGRRGGSESGVFARPRQDDVQVAEPLSDPCRQHLVVGHVIGFRVAGRGRRGEIIEGAEQLIEQPRPGVALIVHEALRHGERESRAIRSDACDLSEQRGRVGKSMLRQIAAHLGLGMRAAGDAPEDLEHHGVADDERAVRLLGREPVDLRVRRQVKRFDAVRSRLEPYLTVGRRPARALRKQGDNLMGEGRHCEAVGEKTDPPLAAHMRQCQLARQRRCRLAFPDQRKRNQPTRRAGARCGLDLGKEKGLLAGQSGKIGKACSLERLVLGGEPSPLCQIRRQHLALEHVPSGLEKGFREIAAQDDRMIFGHGFGGWRVPGRPIALLGEDEPVKSVGRQCEQIGELADRRKRRAVVELDRNPAHELRNVELDRLRTVRDIRYTQNGLALVFAQISQDLPVLRIEEAQRAAAECQMLATYGQTAARPIEQGMRIAALRLDIDGFESIERVHDRREHQGGRIGPREAAVAIGCPLHRRAHAVAVTEIDVVTHADLVTVIDDRRAGHREQQAVQQLDPPPIALEEGR